MIVSIIQTLIRSLHNIRFSGTIMNFLNPFRPVEDNTWAFRETCIVWLKLQMVFPKGQFWPQHCFRCLHDLVDLHLNSKAFAYAEDTAFLCQKWNRATKAVYHWLSWDLKVVWFQSLKSLNSTERQPSYWDFCSVIRCNGMMILIKP